MAGLKIKEYDRTAIGTFGEGVMLFDEEITLYQTAISFTIGGAAVQSVAFTYNYIVLQPDADCYIAFGTNPTATIAGFLKISASERIGFKVPKGWKLSVIG